MNFEQIVRPFQSPRSLATRRIISSSVKIATQTAGGSWGVAGNLPNPVEEDIPTSLDGGFSTECCATGFFELFRETEDVKVYNQKNPNAVVEEDYIVVRRIKSFRGDKKEKECGLQGDPSIAAAFAASEARFYGTGLFSENNPNSPQNKNCKFDVTFKSANA